jgi:hypothetical protein
VHVSKKVLVRTSSYSDTGDRWITPWRTALWRAVFENRPDHARAPVEAGADPWRPMMAGWSPGRLSLAGAHPDLFSPHRAELSATEVASTPGVTKALFAGYGVLYAMYANPKGAEGNQGSIDRGGTITGWDLHPGGWARARGTAS